MNKKHLHINRILSVLLLWVFAIALTPWSSLHHHEEERDYCAQNGKECMHKFHVGSEKHNCLICSAHFEKDYYKDTLTYQVMLPVVIIDKIYTLTGTSYAELISTSLRGPPVAG